MAKSSNIVSSTTYQNIKRDIIFGKLAPASKLKLGALRECYPASMSTLRETLNRLASEGFVDAEDQRGFFVSAVSPEGLVEIANLRVLLECHALLLSIKNGDADWEGNLVAAHHKLHIMEKKMQNGESTVTGDWKRYDWEFHKALIAACGSQNLLLLHSVLFDKYLRYQMLVLTHRGEKAVQEHRELLDAALKRDETRAVDILRLHIERGLSHSAVAFQSADAESAQPL